MNHDGLDLYEDAYCALNCKSGIIACILERSFDIDPSPVWFHAPLGIDDVSPGMEAGEIAGFSCGNFDNTLWRELFAAEVVEWRPESRAEMETWLAQALGRHRMIVVTHDGYFDPLAADKYRRSHTPHNSMLYGVGPDAGSYAIADRGYRATISACDLWRCVEGEIALFTVVMGAHPFAGDIDALVADGLRLLAGAVRVRDTEDKQFAALVVRAARDDVDTPDGRWLQTHAFFNGMAHSRQSFAQALSTTPSHARDDAATVCARLAEAADAWTLLGRFIYKVVSARRTVQEHEVLSRLQAALAADAVVADAMHALAPADGTRRRTRC